MGHYFFYCVDIIIVSLCTHTHTRVSLTFKRIQEHLIEIMCTYLSLLLLKKQTAKYIKISLLKSYK